MIDFHDISKTALWITSSGKVGHEICHILDGSSETFWQSDGTLPHSITAIFPELVLAKEVEIYMDYSVDESYTPFEIIVRLGLQRNELFDLQTVELDEPRGWIGVPLTDLDKSLVPMHILQICVLSNYQDGRDSRIRNIRVIAGLMMSQNIT